MWEEVVRNIPAVSATVSVLAVVGGGTFSFVQWLDVRRREQKQQRWADYSKLLAMVAGDGAKIHLQMGALYQLLAFEDYASISVNALEASNRILAAQGNKPWTDLMAPEVEKVIAILRNISN
jgi:hypothetical protein